VNEATEPAARLASRAQRDGKAAPSAPAKVGPPVEICDVAAQRKSAEREPVALKNNPTTTSTALPPRPAARTVAYGTTKAEVLSRAKAAIEAGESLRAIAERLACAKEDFHTSQRQISRAVGWHPSKVSRVLKWRRTGYKQSSPFGPTTRAGRASRRKNNSGSGGGASEKFDDDGNGSLVGDCSPSHQPALLPAPVDEILPSGSAQTELLPSTEAAKRETKECNTEAGLLGAMGHKRRGSDHGQIKKKKQISKAGQRLLRQRMRRMLIVINTLTESPILSNAARKAGIHRKTLEHWIKRSAAGDAGYDLVWEGIEWRFHEHCITAMSVAYGRVEGPAWELAMGPRYNGKALRFLLEWLRPEKWGKHPKIDVPQQGGVLVVGGVRRDVPNKVNKGTAASVKARKWKAGLRMVRAEKNNADC
jgi:hypothetical protein